MEVWQIILYGTAALLALKSLSSLMTSHRESLVAQIEAEEEQRRQEEARAQAEAAAVKKKTRRAGAA
ncbi:MAG TPA: hypothetical protein VGH74_11725 [Planctomycetaceae bacterium]|jgi:hypothetical protein